MRIDNKLIEDYLNDVYSRQRLELFEHLPLEDLRSMLDMYYNSKFTITISKELINDFEIYYQKINN